MKSFNSTAKKFLVTSALALVAFFAGDCPSNPIFKHLNITKVSINGQNIDLTKPNETQDNITLQPKIDITFSQNVEAKSVQDKIKLTENGTTTVIPVLITQANDSTISVSLGNNQSLKRSTQYTLTITGGIEVAVGGETYKLSNDIMVKFSTITQGNDVSLSVSYMGEEISASGETFTVPVEKSTDLTSVTLTLEVGSGSTISESGTLLSLTNNRVTQAFDFTTEGNQRTFEVTAEDGTTKRTYVVSIIVKTSNSNEITGFVFSQSNNPGLTKDVSGEIEGTKISVNVPSTATRNRLVPTITHTGVSVTPESDVAQDFTDSVQYKVTSESGQERTYTVAVSIGYVVSYHLNGGSLGSVSSLTETVLSGSKATPPITPTKMGYEFVAWCVDQDLSTVYDFESQVVSDLDLYAKWISKSAEITGISVEGESANFAGGTSWTLSKVLAIGATKVSFTGLASSLGSKVVDANAENGIALGESGELLIKNNEVRLEVTAEDEETKKVYVISVSIKSSSSKDITKFVLSVNQNTGLSEEVVGMIDGATKKITLSIPSSLSKSSLTPTITHSGVSITPESGAVQDFTNSKIYMVTAEDKTTQTYQVSVSYIYSVTFNTGFNDVVVASQKVKDGGLATDPGSVTKNGYSFKGWYREALKTNAFVFSTGTIDKDTVIYAKWVPVHTVTFNTGFDGATVPAQKVEEGGKVEEPGSITRSNYTFGGWYKEANHNTLFNFNNETVTGNLTLYAKWTLNTYTITFDSQQGTTVASQTVSHGGKVNRPVSDPTRATYTFGGWYKEATNTTRFDFDHDVITSNTTIYAKWTLNTYTITFDSQQGTTVASQTVSHGGKVNRPVSDPTRATYTFGGWYKEANHNTLFNFNNETVTGNLTLYAKWTLNTYTITFDSQGGTTVPFQTVSHGGKVNRPSSSPVRSGHTFENWYRESNHNTLFDFDHDVITSNITLHAKWLSSSTVLTSIAFSTKTVTFNSVTETLELPYGATFPIAYSTIIKTFGSTAKDVNASDVVLRSSGTLAVSSDTIQIKIESEDKTREQIYKIGINIAKPTTMFYTSTDTLGQAIKDTDLEDFPVMNVSNVASGIYTIKLGNITIFNKRATNGRFTLMQSDIRATNASDDAPLTISYASRTAIPLAYYKPLNIYAWQDLQAMRLNLSGDYALMKNIVFPTPGSNGFPTAGFEPIARDTNVNTSGYQGKKFTGTLVGNGKEIRELRIEREGTLDYVGLFGYIEIAWSTIGAVRDLVLRDPVVKGRDYVGSLVGHFHRGAIQNVRMEGVGLSVKGSSSYVGGLVGYNDGGTLTGYATGDVTGDGWVGGLIGRNRGTVTGYATGDVTGRSDHVGGLVGENKATVRGYATGAVKGSGSYVGGLGGENTGLLRGYATGAVEGGSFVGGLVGRNSATVEGYATGTVKGDASIGALVGQHQSNTAIGYATGKVTATSEAGFVGGLVGQYNGGTVTGYWDATSTGLDTSAAGIRITAIANVEWSTSRYVDKNNSNTPVFNAAPFSNKFIVTETNPGNGKWPKFKDIEFSLPQPDLP